MFLLILFEYITTFKTTVYSHYCTVHIYGYTGLQSTVYNKFYLFDVLHGNV